MGRPKQLLPLGDRCLLQHVLDEAVASCLGQVVLVLGHQAAEIQAQIEVPVGRLVQVVVNANYALGQGTSLRLGLESTDPRAAAAAVLLADQPLVTSQLIDTVAAAFFAGTAAVARPVYSGADSSRVPGHPVVLARRIWPEVEKLRGDEGARTLLAAHPEWLLEVPVGGEAPSDVDTWEDYQRTLELTRGVGEHR